MTCEDIISRLEELSPVKFAEDWDNVGLLVGRKEKDVNNIYIALDATDEVIDRAITLGADMIITHHPMIFTPVKKINSDDFVGRRILRLIRHDIALYAMHTNFDVMGMADAAADELKLKKCSVLSVTYEDEISKEGFGRVGKLPSVMTLEECAEYVKECFKLDHVIVYGDTDNMIETVAICPGSGKSMAGDVIKSNAEAYITGDIGHHDGIDLTANGVSVIDAGHFGVEKLFVPYMKEYLTRQFPDMTVNMHHQKAPSVVI